MDQRTPDVQVNQPLFSTTFWSWSTYMYSPSSCRTEYAGIVIEVPHVPALLFRSHSSPTCLKKWTTNLRGTLSERERERERVRQTETRHTQGCTAIAVNREIDGEVEEEGEAELISGDKTSQ
uniref:Uncharacterized protein n=1 Tax=Timema tahoe TaxID=61484 RepID=A0A7R9NUQ3_9NEOP|nr:unnamed protein product [Timema tahoe]